MSGQVMVLINRLIDTRAKGNPIVATTTRTKLLLKGIKPDSWTADSPDDATMIAKVREAAREMGVAL